MTLVMEVWPSQCGTEDCRMPVFGFTSGRSYLLDLGLDFITTLVESVDNSPVILCNNCEIFISKDTY